MAATTYEPWGSSGWALGPGLERIKGSLEGDTYPSAVRGSSRLCRLCEGAGGGALSQRVRSLGRALFVLTGLSLDASRPQELALDCFGLQVERGSLETVQ